VARDEHFSELDAARGRTTEDLCPFADRIGELEEGLSRLRAVVVGQPPDEDNGLRKRLRTVEDAVRQLKIIKWGVFALLALKSPDLVALFKTLHF
jgi:hypothetical protein